MALAAADSDHRVGLGIACSLVAVLFFATSDGVAKWLGQLGYGAGEIVFLRYVFGLLPVLVMLRRSGLGALRTRRPGLHLLRALLIGSALMLFFSGLKVLPLAEAIGIAFTAPLFITALAGPVLGEKVGPRRWAAVLVGFLGALIILRPGTAAFQPTALLIVGSALCFSCAMLLTRRMAPSETNVAMFTYSTLGAGITALPLALWDWRAPALAHLWGFVFLGIVGGTAAFLVIKAYRHAPAAVVAPFDYTALIWGALIGWFLWQEEPSVAVWIGAGVVAAAGVYITHRETRPSGRD